MLSLSRTPLVVILFPALLALLPGCQSCAGGDKDDQPPATKTEELPQMRGLQKVRMARPDMLGVREAGAAATPPSSAIAAPTLSAAAAPSASH